MAKSTMKSKNNMASQVSRPIYTLGPTS